MDYFSYTNTRIPMYNTGNAVYYVNFPDRKATLVDGVTVPYSHAGVLTIVNGKPRYDEYTVASGNVSVVDDGTWNRRNVTGVPLKNGEVDHQKYAEVISKMFKGQNVNLIHQPNSDAVKVRTSIDSQKGSESTYCVLGNNCGNEAARVITDGTSGWEKVKGRVGNFIFGISPNIRQLGYQISGHDVYNGNT